MKRCPHVERPPSVARVVITVVALFSRRAASAWAASSAQRTGPVRDQAHRTVRGQDHGKRGPRGLPGPKVQGPRGAQGSQGIQGLQGAQGPIGPSNGYVKSLPAATALAAGVDTTVVQLTLTPGSSYIVIAASRAGQRKRRYQPGQLHAA